jgi:PAS domain S-box-containing protein
MRRFRDLAFKHKLTLLALFASAVTMLLASGILLWSEGQRSQRWGEAHVRSLANVLGATSVAALEFGDASAAQENLATARLEPMVVAARLYRADGTVLATYVRAGDEGHALPDHPRDARALQQGRYLTYVGPVSFQGERSGWILVEADIGSLAHRLRSYGATVLLALAASLAFALPIAQRLQRTMSAPIEELTAAVRAVAGRGDYSVRVPVQGRDELSVLSGGFNQMLSRIQEQDADLRAARDTLERRVEERLQDVRREIQEREKTQAALDDSERRFRSIVESTNERVWSCDAEGRWTYNNPALERILGWTPEELLGRSHEEILHPDDVKRVALLRETHQIHELGWSGLPLRWRHKDGGYRTLESVGSAVRGPDGTPVGWQGLDRDITDRLGLEEQLRQAQKMEAIGRLAGGVAHDFNNLLGVILGHSELLLDSADKKVEMRVRNIRGAADRAAGLTRQLLAFSRRQLLEPKVIDLNGLVLDLGRMLPRLLGEDVMLQLRPGTDVGRIKADPTQIEQVIMNLAVNARDAMPRGGHLVIGTGSLQADSAARGGPRLEPGPYVRLTVSDTGCGMDQETLAMIYEPFFTTKEPGKGTGLGLSTVYGIVKQSGGSIFARSEPGAGTTFDIYLPCVEGRTEEELVEEPPPPRGSERILVVEDESSLRELIGEILGGLGYDVTATGSGAEALRVARDAGPPDLLLTDVVMPAMSGRELATILRGEMPSLRVLYMSGYTDDAVVRHGVAAGSSLVQKPFTTHLLATRVREALGSRG